MAEELKNQSLISEKSKLHEKEEENSPNVIKQATQMVDSVTNMLFAQITGGKLVVPPQEQSLKNIVKRQRSSMVTLEMKTVDIDEHKRMVKKFIRQNKKIKKKRQIRSLEQSQKSLRMQKQFQMNKMNERNQAIEQRRRQIEKRMQAKKSMMHEIKKGALESSEQVKILRKKKFLYQQKQDQFYKNVVLPRIQEEKKIIEKKKELRRAMDLSEIQAHEKQYDELRINEQINRSVTIKMIKEEQRSYSPPPFIPTSYRIFQKEEKGKKEEQLIRKRQNQINTMKKKEYSRYIEELREKQRQLLKSRAQPKGREAKEKAIEQKSRQQTKKIGNEYLKALLSSKKRFMTTKKIQEPITVPESPKKKIKSEFEISIIKEERIEKVHKIKAKKIEGIVNDRSLDNFSKYERLKHETQKLDEEAEYKLKEGEDIKTINESASIMMNSIHAKLAMLAFNSNKKF